MAETKRQPQIFMNATGPETIIFDENHTINDFLRYLLLQSTRQELIQLIKDVR